MTRQITSVFGLNVNASAQLESATQPPATIASSSSPTPITVASSTRPGRSTRM